jgi:hypothetical protein
MAITYGSDFATAANLTADSATAALTLGSVGANSVLFVDIEAESNYSTPLTVTYNGVALTSLGKNTYTGSGTANKELWYLVGNLTSGQNLFINSTTPTTLGQLSSKVWRYRTWTYGGVSAIGAATADATTFTTSATGSPATVAYNFTPTVSTSTIMQLLAGNSISTTTSSYATVNGTVRQAIATSVMGAVSTWFAFSDYAPGSTSLYSLSQSFNANFTSATGWGWGVELKPVGGVTITSRNTQAVWI